MWSIETDTPEHAEFFRAYFTAHPEERGLVGRPENVPGLRAGLLAAVQGDAEPLEKHLRETT